MLLGTLGTSLLENLLTSKEVKATRRRQGVIRSGEGIIRAGQDV